MLATFIIYCYNKQFKLEIVVMLRQYKQISVLQCFYLRLKFLFSTPKRVF